MRVVCKIKLILSVSQVILTNCICYTEVFSILIGGFLGHNYYGIYVCLNVE